MTREEKLAYQRKWYRENPGKHAEYNRKSKEKRKEMGLPPSQVYDPVRYEKNKDRYRKAHDEWVARNKEHVREYYKKKYAEYKQNPEFVARQKAYNQKYAIEKEIRRLEKVRKLKQTRKERAMDRITEIMEQYNITLYELRGHVKTRSVKEENDKVI